MKQRQLNDWHVLFLQWSAQVIETLPWQDAKAHSAFDRWGGQHPGLAPATGSADGKLKRTELITFNSSSSH